MITEWLDAFKTGWITKNIDQILNLFTDDVEYWETPYQRIKNRDALKQEWNNILKQENIELDLEIFSTVDNKHTILWKLSYDNENSVTQQWAGTYLIELDEAGKCSYFYQTGEIR